MRKVLVASCAMLAGACSAAPASERPWVAVSLPSHWPGAASADDTAGQAAAIRWQAYFSDPRLNAMIAAALAQNQNLAQSVARVAQARAQFRIAASDRVPQLSLLASSTNNQPETMPNVQVVGVSIADFELDLWGRLASLAEADRRRYLAEAQAERAFRLSLIGQVAATYFAMLQAEERGALARRRVATFEKEERIVRARVAAGLGDASGLSEAEFRVAGARDFLARTVVAEEEARNFLRVLVGGDLPGSPATGLGLTDPRHVADVPAGLPSQLLVVRPDILRAEHLVGEADANVKAARAAMFPSISLSAAGGLLSNSLRDLLKSNRSGYQLSGAALLPIFDAGRRRNDLRFNQALAEERVAAYRLAIQGAFSEVADALVGREHFGRAVISRKDAVARRRAQLAVARRKLDLGAASEMDLLAADHGLIDAELELLGARYAELQAAVALYVALGGGSAEI